MSQEPSPQHQPPFEVPSIAEIGALLPQFAFEKLAAFGGMGAVYKARQESLDRPVAIKILPPAFGAEPEFAERFKSEARAMAKLNHTNIVAVYDFGITRGGHLYLVMEWVEGPTLHELIHSKGVLPMKKAASLAVQLCDALSYAHNHRILHRDIKPGNIMINQEDQVKVTDFGLARPITGEAEENPYGTPEYAAPEILNKGAVDQRADIFAAGVVLYEMLTGRVPKSPRRSVTEYAPISPAWDHVIDMATNPEPEKRFMDARDLRAHIVNLLNRAEAAAIPVAAVVVDEADQKPNPAKFRLTPLHYGMMGAAGAIIVSVGFAALFRGKPEPEAPRAKRIAEAKARPAENNDSPERPKKKRPAEEAAAAAEPEKQRKKREPLTVAAAPQPGPEPKMPAGAAADKKRKNNNGSGKDEPGSKPAEPAPAPAASMAAAPAAAAPPVPSPEDPHTAIQRLEESDPELTQLVASFAGEWNANSDIDTAPETRDLGSKYVPALQRILTGLPPEQRDHVLSEISHVSNQEPLNEPADTWPPALKNLRQTYNAQTAAIEAAADAAAQKLRSAHCEALMTKARERTAAGDAAGARRAEAVAALMAKLDGMPSLKAIKDSVAMNSNGNGATR